LFGADTDIGIGFFTIGFSAGVVGLAMAKGTKTNAKPMQNRFSLTPNSNYRHPGIDQLPHGFSSISLSRT
jgi:hypothetical protein